MLPFDLPEAESVLPPDFELLLDLELLSDLELLLDFEPDPCWEERSDFDDLPDFSDFDDLPESAASATPPERLNGPGCIGAIREKAAAMTAKRPGMRIW